ncbi:MAG: efflux RND transporter periplasmic adaptor subunit [Bacteroidota bacterium]|nr:efflux RND transporter periplasmic adaptor subunit [Bacteroidota bacterium]
MKLLFRYINHHLTMGIKQFANCKFTSCSLPIILRLLPIAFCLLLILPGCNQHVNDNATSSSSDLYTCSMHPQVLEDHPGNCPICGMKLIKKNAAPVAVDNINLETLLKPTNEFVVASLPVTTLQQSNMNIPLKVYGTIEADTRAAGSVSARVSGRIEKLYLRSRFQKINAGQKVAEIYSPELVTAQENLLFLLKNDAQNTSFIQAAKQKLLLLGMSATELNKVVTTGKPLYSVSIYSNYSGHVHDAGMTNNMSGTNAKETEMNNAAPVTQELALKEGMYVNKGQTLFMIMNHHKAWAALQIFPNQQSLIKKGDRVQIVPETDTTAVISGTINFIEPFFRGNSKTLTARVYFHNMDMLTVGSQVTANIYTDSKQGLWLPQTAVVSLGRNEVAFLKSAGGFMAHKVTTGTRSEGKVQILSGLNTTDSVATNAQYLVDSESFIQANE